MKVADCAGGLILSLTCPDIMDSRPENECLVSLSASGMKCSLRLVISRGSKFNIDLRNNKLRPHQKVRLVAVLEQTAGRRFHVVFHLLCRRGREAVESSHKKKEKNLGI